MADTKITRLRNLLTPVVNYFAIQGKLETGEYPDDKYEKLHELLYLDNVQARKNLKEIREIIAEIPDNACEGNPVNSEAANCAIFDVKHSADAAFCCSIEQEKIPYSNMIRTILKIEAGQINSEEFRNDLMKLLQKHCA